MPAPQNIGLFGVEVKWRKQYGPTPATAKFTDVNPQHPYFTEIEMLGKSGVPMAAATTSIAPTHR